MGRAAKTTSQTPIPEMIPGELGDLLAQIETEAVPERLLELAVRLQAALQLSRTSMQEKTALVES